MVVAAMRGRAFTPAPRASNPRSMMVRFSRQALAALSAALLTAACATGPGGSDLNISELVRVDPEDLMVRATVPTGLSETGRAYIRWSLRNPDESSSSDELYELVRDSAVATEDGSATQATYSLKETDFNRFRNQQVLQRAQLLAGFYYMNLLVLPDMCDEAGVPVKGGHVIVSLTNTGTQARIMTSRLDETAAEIERAARYCI